VFENLCVFIIRYSNGLKGQFLEHPDSRIFESICTNVEIQSSGYFHLRTCFVSCLIFHAKEVN
jgi:hypothetical protein